MSMLRAEFGYFLGAVQFLTRLPVPPLEGFAPEWLDRGVKYFPLAGILVGSSALAFISWLRRCGPALCLRFSRLRRESRSPAPSMRMVSPTSSIAWVAEPRSAARHHEGQPAWAFGALALGLRWPSRCCACRHPCSVVSAALIAAHAGGRFAASLSCLAALRGRPDEGEGEAARNKHHLFWARRRLCLRPAACFPAAAGGGVFACLAGFAAAAFIAWRAQLLGGYTGDVLGAVEQSFEIAFLLTAAACA